MMEAEDDEEWPSEGADVAGASRKKRAKKNRNQKKNQARKAQELREELDGQVRANELLRRQLDAQAESPSDRLRCLQAGLRVEEALPGEEPLAQRIDSAYKEGQITRAQRREYHEIRKWRNEAAHAPIGTFGTIVHGSPEWDAAQELGTA